MKRNLTLAAVLALVLPAAAFAHPGHSNAGITGGLAHPLTGLDHLLAMLAVGILAARIGGRSLWLLPLSFISAMLLGGAMAWAHIGLPMIESGIAASVVVLGVMLAIARPISLRVVLPLIAAFAVFHGYAHVSELSGSAAAFIAGFTLSTALLHLLGIGVGLLFWAIPSTRPIRILGTGMAMAGLLIGFGVL